MERTEFTFTNAKIKFFAPLLIQRITIKRIDTGEEKIFRKEPKPQKKIGFRRIFILHTLREGSNNTLIGIPTKKPNLSHLRFKNKTRPENQSLLRIDFRSCFIKVKQ